MASFFCLRVYFRSGAPMQTEPMTKPDALRAYARLEVALKHFISGGIKGRTELAEVAESFTVALEEVIGFQVWPVAVPRMSIFRGGA